MHLAAALASITSTSRACRTLRRVELFAVGPIGPGARISKGERALARILREPDAATMLVELLSHASLAGRLYALLGLRDSGYPHIEGLFAEFRRLTGEVRTQIGCFGSSQPISSIVERIADGTYWLRGYEGNQKIVLRKERDESKLNH